MPQNADPTTQQIGFGLAAHIVLTTLLDKLAEKSIFSRDELKEFLEHALLNAETSQAVAPSPEIVTSARTAIETLIAASEVKRLRLENLPPSVDQQS